MKSYIQNYIINNEKVTDTEKFVVIADLHDLKIKRMKDIIDNINKVGAKFVALVGDIMQGYKYGREKEISDLSKTIASLSENQPLVLSLGNHDLVSLTNEGRKNFKKLESIRKGMVFPLDNNYVEIDKFRITGFCPSRKSFKLSYQNNGKASKIFARDFNRASLRPKNDGKIEVLMNHDPHNVAGAIVQNLVPNMQKFDMIVSGHLHNGYVLSRKSIENPTKYFDYGYREMPYEKSKLRPWIYEKTNLCRGVSYVGREGFRVLQLIDNDFYLVVDDSLKDFYKNEKCDINETFVLLDYEKAQNFIREKKLVPIIISGGINKFFSMPFDKAEITTVEVVNREKQLRKF